MPIAPDSLDAAFQAEPPMAEPIVLTPRPRRKAARRGGADALSWTAALFFIMAVAACAYPAFKAGPTTGPGLLLLIGLAGVAFLGVFAFATSEPPPAIDPDEGASELVEALAEPAAAARIDGRVVSVNAAWRALMGEAKRLPKAGSTGAGLYAALVAARRHGGGEARVMAGGRERPAAVSRLGGERLLVRLLDDDILPQRLLTGEAAPAPVPVQQHAAPSNLDAFASAAPFGAALLEGHDPLDAVIVEANPALVALTEGLAVPGAPFGALIDPASRAEARARLAARKGPVEVRLALDAPKIAHLYVTAADGRLVAYLLDVSEQKQLELQLGQSQKMQAIGQLAGGVAHDFNNLLTAIQLRLDELLQRHPVGDPSYEGLNEIRQTGVRAADLVRKLLAFSRKQTVQRETLDLGELISEFEVLLRRLLRVDV